MTLQQTLQDRESLANRRLSFWFTTLFCAATFAFYASLLYHLVFRGWAHTYDSAIYVRSLWGVAHGVLFNPVVGLHSLSIHGNFVLYLLAPFSRVIPPAVVLIAAQALAFTATTWVAMRAWEREAMAAYVDQWGRLAVAAFSGFAFIACSPLFSNPFLFDVRPGLIGVPLLTWGLCRAHERGQFDGWGLAAMFASLLVREEFMMVIVGGLILAPMSPRKQTKLRIGGAVLAVGYWAFYWFGIRNWIGDGSYELAQEVGTAFLEADVLTTGQVVGYKAEILAVFCASMGGAVLLGWRWMGAAIPGLLFLLITGRMQALVLNFHYVQFVVPGLVVASVDGYRQWLRSDESGGSLLPIVSAVLMTLSYTMSSALPGGGRHMSEHFNVGVTRSDEDLARFEQLRQVYALAETIPEDVAVAMPHGAAAPFADREVLIPAITLFEQLAASPDLVPYDVEWLMAPGRNWNAVRPLVERHGFRLVEIEVPRIALLTRDPNVAVGASVGLRDTACENVLATWPSAGLSLCSVARGQGGQVGVQIARTAPRTDASPVAVMVRPHQTNQPVPALGWGGMLNAANMPVGKSFVFATTGPVADAAGYALDVTLLSIAPGGRLVPISNAAGAIHTTLEGTW